MDTDENGVEGRGRESDAETGGWGQGREGRELEAHGKRREERRSGEGDHTEGGTDNRGNNKRGGGGGT